MMTEATSPLTTLLRCLDKDDVSELQLFAGKTIGVLRAGNVTPLTRVPLTNAHIEGLVAGTALVAAIAADSPLPRPLDVQIGGRGCRCVVSRRQGLIQLRIARGLSQANVPPSAPVHAGPVSALPVQTAADALAEAVLARKPVSQPSAQTTPSSVARQPSSLAAGPSAEGSQILPREPSSELTAIAARVPVVDTAQDAGEVAPALSLLLEGAWRQGASDVHLFADAPMRLRRAGMLEPVGETLAAAALEPMLLALLSVVEKQVLATRGYVDKAIGTAQGRLRVNISRNTQGLKASLRLIPWQVPTLASLGLPRELEAVGRMHQGLVVVAGPTGHGKTATLAAMVDCINDHAAHHIITVEDPIEYVHPLKHALMSQRQVGLHTQSFARALKASLREDPDIIVIGELRDRETVEIALAAAETGHLVLTSINTRSATRAIDRLIDLFPPEDQTQVRTTLASALKMVVGQKLIPGAQGGLVAACEMISHCVPLAALIRDAKLFQLPSLMQRGRSAGMLKLDTSLVELVRTSKITAQNARMSAEHPAELERALTVAASAASLTPSTT